jgi:hypothetical protein
MKTHARLIATLALAAFAAFGLSACTTTPDPAPAPVVTKTTVDLLLEVRSKELDLERTDQMAWLKFAAESGSDMVKGFVMGKSAAKGVGAAQSSTAQTIAQAQAQADETALRREQLADKNSAWNRSLQLFDRVVPVVMFSQGLKFQKFQVQETNAQNRYTLDTLRGAQSDGFSQGSGAALGGVSAGSGATLGGVSAGAAAASAGASAVAGALAPTPVPTTPAE